MKTNSCHKLFQRPNRLKQWMELYKNLLEALIESIKGSQEGICQGKGPVLILNDDRNIAVKEVVGTHLKCHAMADNRVHHGIMKLSHVMLVALIKTLKVKSEQQKKKLPSTQNLDTTRTGKVQFKITLILHIPRQANSILNIWPCKISSEIMAMYL